MKFLGVLFLVMIISPIIVMFIDSFIPKKCPRCKKMFKRLFLGECIPCGIKTTEEADRIFAAYFVLTV